MEETKNTENENVSFDTNEDSSQMDLVSVNSSKPVQRNLLPFQIPNIKEAFDSAVLDFRRFLKVEKPNNFNYEKEFGKKTKKKNKKGEDGIEGIDHKKTIGILHKDQKEVYFQKKEDPIDEKGLVSLFWKRKEKSIHQKFNVRDKDPPPYEDIGPPSFLDSIINPKIEVNSLVISKANQTKIRKEQIQRIFYSFQYLNKEQSVELHNSNVENMITIFGRFLNCIENSSWFLSRDDHSLFTQKEIQFLEAVGKDKFMKELKKKRVANLEKARETRKEMAAFPVQGKEYLIIRSDIVKQMDTLIELIEQLNWYEAYDEDIYPDLPLNKIF